MDEIEVRVEADVNPTEDEAKVRQALENTFSNLEFEARPQKRGSLQVGKTRSIDSLTKLNNLLRRERIRAAARGAMFEGLSGCLLYTSDAADE